MRNSVVSTPAQDGVRRVDAVASAVAQGHRIDPYVRALANQLSRGRALVVVQLTYDTTGLRRKKLSEYQASNPSSRPVKATS